MEGVATAGLSKLCHRQLGTQRSGPPAGARGTAVEGKAVTKLPEKVVFLFDVDNTLLDNDQVVADLMRYLEREIGSERQQRYWDYFEQLRTELGYADYLGALQRYRLEYQRDSHILAVSNYLIDYPFTSRLFPNSLDVLEHAGRLGQTVIVSDGDVVFQPLKVSVPVSWTRSIPESRSIFTKNRNSTISLRAIRRSITC